MRTTIAIVLALHVAALAQGGGAAVGNSAPITRTPPIAEYEALRRDRALLAKKAERLQGESTEGGRAAVYLKGGSVRAVEATYFGETGRVSYEFFYSAGKLVLAREVQYAYNAPIYFSESVAAQWSKDDGVRYEPFSEGKTRSVQHIFWFRGQSAPEHAGATRTLANEDWNTQERANRVREIGMDLLKRFGAQ